MKRDPRYQPGQVWHWVVRGEEEVGYCVLLRFVKRTVGVHGKYESFPRETWQVLDLDPDRAGQIVMADLHDIMYTGDDSHWVRVS